MDIRAGRDKGLEKNDGVIAAIKEVVNDDQPYLDEATVTGTRANELSETTIRASNNVEHTKVRVETDDAGVAVAGDIKSKLLRFVGLL